MNVAIIGGGISGVLIALLLKRGNKNIEVSIFEKENKLLKKLMVTGNGRCNLGNTLLDSNSYNNKNTFDIYNSFNYVQQIKLLNSFGIYTRNINNLYYPYSLSAKNLCENLLFLLNYYKVDINLESQLIDYQLEKNKYHLFLKDKKIDETFDYLLITSGGLTYYKSSYSASIYKLLEKHGYEINNLRVGLNAIKVVENVKTLENLRVKCIASLIYNNELLYKENGEVIFKKDGISGICIFNILSIIQRKRLKGNVTISLNVVNDLNDLKNITNSSLFKEKYLEGLFDKRLSLYIKNYCKKNNLNLFDALNNLSFTYKEPYDFNSGQVSIGGVSYSNLDEYNFSILEKNMGFAGEILDSDGLCGGYNLMFCIASSQLIANQILKLSKI